MRLESDTYSQLSHRAPLYIDQYYRGQIGIVISLCAGGEKKGKVEFEVQHTHCPGVKYMQLNLHLCLSVCIWGKVLNCIFAACNN